MLVSFVVAYGTACGPSVEQPSPRPTPTNVIGSASPASTPVTLTGSRPIATDWVYVGNVAVSPRWFAWSGVHEGDATRESQELMLMERASGVVRTIARGPSPAGLFAWLRINDEWAVWADYTDRTQISDWRVLAMRLPNGPTTTLMTAAPNAGTGDRPEFALSGGQLIVSARPAGAQRMQLLLISLATGEKRTLRTAEQGETFGWPAIDGDVAAAESHQASTDRVIVFSSVAAGKSEILGNSGQPMSEPTMAGRWLAFKAAPRGADGKLLLRNLDTGSVTPLADSVEAPVGGGSTFVWSPGGGANVIFGVDKDSGSAFTFQVEKASRGFYAHDGRTLLFTIRIFDGARRDQVFALDLPKG